MSNPMQPTGNDELRGWTYDAPEADGVEYLADTTDEQAGPDYDSSPKGVSAMPERTPMDFEEPIQRRIRGLDEDRAAFVAKRRIPSSGVAAAVNKVIPYGGLLSSAFNLASSSLGAGIIALPSAFKISGLGMAIIYLVGVGLLTVYSFRLLAIAGRHTGLRNYEQITRCLLGPGADYFLAFCMWLLSFGAEVSYVISVRNVLEVFLGSSNSTPEFLTTGVGQGLLTSLVWLVAMLPLCLPKEINSLRYFSLIAVGFILYFVLCVVIHSCMAMRERGPAKSLTFFESGNHAIQGLSIFMFSFICQLNMYEVYGELYKPSVNRLTLGAGFGVLLCFVLYFITGLFGYLDFGVSVQGSLLLMYNPLKDLMFSVGYAGFMLKLCVGYGLHMIPVRDAIYHVVKVDVVTIAWWKNACVCGAMAALSLLGGLFIPKINTVFGLVGGFSGGFIGFVFPALLFMYSGNWSLRSVGWMDYFSTYILLIVGVIGVVFGTAASIYDVAVGS